jgi:thiamine biosynthesis lipoprotein
VSRALLAALLLAGCASPEPSTSQRLSDGRYVMGTVLEVTLHGSDLARLARARDRVFALAEHLEGLLSSYRDTSDISRLNAAGGAPLRVEPEVLDLLRASLGFTGLSRGSFDVTVGPLVSLWTRAAERDRLPGESEIAAARQRVGAANVRIAADGEIALAEGARLDLGGIAKGFALDRMLPVLREEGVESALLSFGQSSAWALGAPPGAPGWTLLARAPEGGFAGLLTLRDRALSVSGSLGQWSEIEGRRYGHVVDPRTGWPLTRRRQALVVARHAALAEALSKALLILGEGEGIEVVAARPDCEGLLLDAQGERYSTPGFAAEAAFEPLGEPAEPGV